METVHDCRVYLRGYFPPQHSLTEYGLCTWAEELWGQVNTVKIEYNQIILDFFNKESAVLCFNQGTAAFGKLVLKIFSSHLMLLNGVFVSNLESSARRSDLLNIFNEFGEVAFTAGPFSSPDGSTKSAVVVFKCRKALDNVLSSREILGGGKKLCVEEYNKNTSNCKEKAEKLQHVVNDVSEEEVEVVNVESPDLVWVRLESDEDRWAELHQAVQSVGQGT